MCVLTDGAGGGVGYGGRGQATHTADGVAPCLGRPPTLSRPRLSPSPQMSGRAGRRGMDDRGIAIMMLGGPDSTGEVEEDTVRAIIQVGGGGGRKGGGEGGGRDSDAGGGGPWGSGRAALVAPGPVHGILLSGPAPDLPPSPQPLNILVT